MSRDDCETGKRLITPHIEIGKGIEPSPNLNAYINVSTFEDCLEHLIRPFTDKGPTLMKRTDNYCVYGVVGRIVGGKAHIFLNIAEPPISRTLMGFLQADVLAGNLPKVYKILNSRS